MTIREIRKRAKAAGVTLETTSKAELIRAVQAAEGNPQCFHSGRERCAETGCCWLEDCVPQQFAETHAAKGVGARTGPWRQ